MGPFGRAGEDAEGAGDVGVGLRLLGEEGPQAVGSRHTDEVTHARGSDALHGDGVPVFELLCVVDHLVGAPILANYFKEKINGKPEEYVVVSPDLGSVTRARNFAARLGCSIAIIDKRRPRPNECEVMSIIGEVKGKKVILVDDMIDTAGTLCNAAQAVIERGGATEVYAGATHAVLSGPAIQRIKDSVMKEVVLLDTINLPEEKKLDKFTTLPVAPVFAEAIERIYEDKPVSSIFN